MIKLSIDFLQFLHTVAPLLTTLAIFTLLAILLADSIRKHATIYYTVLAIPLVLVAVPLIGRMFGVEIYSFNRIPFLGAVLRDYIHMGTWGFPLLVIIMYTGALNLRNRYAKRLLGIRKELSIISGFPVLTHSLVRVTSNFPNALKFFTDNEGYMSTTKVASELGAGFTNFSFVLGVLMIALFIPLWVTSFGSIRRRMGPVKWKKLQRWAYVFYATLFIHAMAIQLGSLLNPRESNAPKPAVENTVSPAIAHKGERGERKPGHTVDSRVNQPETAKPAGNARIQAKGFSDITVSRQVKQYIHVTSLVLIFGSYLYFRVRKAIKFAKTRPINHVFLHKKRGLS